MESIRVIHVFLASPGDVSGERLAAEEVVSEVNAVVGKKLGWRVELNKWEEVGPGYARPQQIINPLVDKCDVFLGLLWERWGQPTGEFSSGFEEEFERARRRYHAEQKPYIWLYFKKPSQDKLNDPGPELQQVLTFRKKQIDAKELFFNEVADVADWKTKIRKALHDLILTRVAEPSAVASSPVQPSSSTVTQDLAQPEIQAPEGNEAFAQLVDATSAFSAFLKSGEQNTISEAEAMRLSLAASTLVSQRYTSETLQVHAQNRVYKLRKSLSITTSEWKLLLRTLVEDSSDVIPGWYWLEGHDEVIDKILISLVIDDAFESVSIGALGLLRSGLFPATDFVLERVLWEGMPSTVRAEALEYLEAVADPDVLKSLEASGKLSAEELQEIKFAVLARMDPSTAFLNLASSSGYIGSRLEYFDGAMGTLSDLALVAGVSSHDGSIRLRSVRELRLRRKLTEERAIELTNDISLDVRATAYLALAEMGKYVDVDEVKKALEPKEDNRNALSVMFSRSEVIDRDEVFTELLSNLPKDELLSRIEYFSSIGPLAYRAAASKFPDQFRKIRDDLATNFEGLRQSEIRRLKQTEGEHLAEVVVKGFAKLEDFIRSQFSHAAIACLARHPMPGDEVFARRFLTEFYQPVLKDALAILAVVGSNEDVPALLKIASDAASEVRRLAAAIALKLSEDPATVALELLRSTDRAVARSALDWVLKNRSKTASEWFLNALNSDDHLERLRAVYYFFRTSSQERLAELLDETLLQGTYFYNVVSWLDRLCFAPPKLRNAFDELLTKAIS